MALVVFTKKASPTFVMSKFTPVEGKLCLHSSENCGHHTDMFDKIIIIITRA